MNREAMDSIGEDRSGAVEVWGVTRKPGLAIDLLPDGSRLSGNRLQEHIFSGAWEELRVSRQSNGEVVRLIAISGNN